MSTLKQTKFEQDKERLIWICMQHSVSRHIANMIALAYLVKPKKTDEEQLLFDFGDNLDSN